MKYKILFFTVIFYAFNCFASEQDQNVMFTNNTILVTDTYQNFPDFSENNFEIANNFMTTLWENFYDNSIPITESFATDDDCIDAGYTLQVISDCANSQFYMSITFLNLGSNEFYEVTDGDITEVIGEDMIQEELLFGPYPVGEIISFVMSPQDSNCNAVPFYALDNCPDAVAIDFCDDIDEIIVGVNFEDFATLADNSNATDSGVESPGCAAYQGGDVWYAATVPANGLLTVETRSNGDFNDTGLAVYGGADCENLVLLACNDDSGVGLMSLVELSNLTPGETVYIRLWSWADNMRGSFLFSAYSPTCLAPEFTSNSVQDCENDQFNVVMNFYNLGSANEISISDDQNSGAQTITEQGTVEFGPYADGAEITFVINTGDDNCNTYFTQSSMCPDPIQFCDDAVALEVGANFEDFATVADNTGATDSGVENPECGNYQGGDIWYSVIVPASGLLTIETQSNGALNDTSLAVYGGADCDNLSLIACNDDGGMGLMSLVELSNLTPGETVYIRLWSWAGNVQGSFLVSAYSATCALPQYYTNILDDCDNDQFSINLNVYDLGSASEISITDDQNSEGQTITEQGTLEFGPYAEGTEVTFYMNTGDENCDTSFSLSSNCPQPIQYCDDAVALTVGANFDDFATVADNTNAEDSGVENPGCGNYQGGDIWYSVIVPANGLLTIETQSNDGEVSDTGMAIYGGSDCEDLEFLACNDDGGDAFFSLIELTDLTPGETVYIRLWTWSNNTQGSFLVSAYSPTCLAPEFTSNSVQDCENDQFNVVMNFYDLGSVNEISISDDQNSEAQTITEQGVVEFGPYADGAEITFVINTGDDNCNTSFTQSSICPDSIQFCDDALELTVGDSFEDFAAIADNTGATNSGVANPSCGNYQGGDIWYSATVPASGLLSVETQSNGGLSDTGLAVYGGADCEDLTLLACNDDGGMGLMSLVELSNLTPGETVYIRLWSWAGNSQGSFLVSAYQPMADNNDCFDMEMLNLGVTHQGNTFLAYGSDATVTSSCGYSGENDLWYGLEVPQDGNVTVALSENENTIISGLSIYSGDCQNLTEIACEIGTASDMPSIELQGLIPGEILFIRTWTINGNGSYGVTAFGSETLGVSDIDTNDFTMYPNPTSDWIQIKGMDVEKASVFTMSGKLIPIELNNNRIDVRKLETGTYLIQLYGTDGNMKTEKFIKK